MLRSPILIVLRTVPLSTFLSSPFLDKMIGIHTACGSLFVHDAMSTFPTANGLPWLDLVFYATIFKNNLNMMDKYQCVFLPAHMYSISCRGAKFVIAPWPPMVPF